MVMYACACVCVCAGCVAEFASADKAHEMFC